MGIGIPIPPGYTYPPAPWISNALVFRCFWSVAVLIWIFFTTDSLLISTFARQVWGGSFHLTLTLRYLSQQFRGLSELRLLKHRTGLNDSGFPVDPVHCALGIYVHTDWEVHVRKQDTLWGICVQSHLVDLLVVRISENHELWQQPICKKTRDNLITELYKAIATIILITKFDTNYKLNRNHFLRIILSWVALQFREDIGPTQWM